MLLNEWQYLILFDLNHRGEGDRHKAQKDQQTLHLAVKRQTKNVRDKSDRHKVHKNKQTLHLAEKDSHKEILEANVTDTRPTKTNRLFILLKKTDKKNVRG